jgi:hypothetical protein
LPGANKPTGGVFYTYADDSLAGDSVEGVPVNNPFTSEAYGAFLRGPIIRDSLFFAVAWERTRESAPLTFRSGGLGALRTSSRAWSSRKWRSSRTSPATDMASTPGGVPISAPENDDRVTARVDWNINEDHDLSLTYIYNQGTQFVDGSSSTSTTQSRLALFSNSYSCRRWCIRALRS